MTNNTCPIVGCDRPLKRGGYCYGHYMKNWRYGTPTPEWPPKWDDMSGDRLGTLLVVERVGSKWRCTCDCGRERLASAGELNREGEANTCGDRTVHGRRDDAGYTAAHQRCRSDRGLAQSHRCVDCSRQAQHWSYDHNDPDERMAHGLSARPIAYSLAPSHYSPRCVSCHKRFDLGRMDAA